MNEGLLSRIGRIISASANSLVDAVENAAPDMVMEEAIREVDAAIDDVRQELGKLEAQKHLATKQLNRDNTEHAELAGQLEVAISQQRDDLAEAAIARQMDIEAQIPVLEKAMEDQRDKIKELNSYIDALMAKKREMQAALRDFRETRADNANSPAASSDQQGKVRAEKASSAFDRVLNNAGGPQRIAMSKDAAKLAELDELSRKNRIQERLAQMKAQNKDD